MDEQELCLKFGANTVSENKEGMFNEETYKEYMANEGMYSKCIEDDEIVDVEAILPINEFDVLQ